MNEQNGHKKRACLYDRVSTQQQKQKGYSADAQFKDTQAFAESLGCEVVLRLSDVDSGAEWNLPGLNALLKAARERRLDVVICYDPDRFARNMTKQFVIEEELRRHGVPLLFARFKLEDTAEGRLLKNQLTAFAEYEREKIQMRTMRGKREKAERGLVIGIGSAPYGYRWTLNRDDKRVGLEPDPLTAPIARRIFQLSMTHSAPAVAQMLNEQKTPGPTGGRWGASVIAKMVTNPVYIGTYLHGSNETYKARALENESVIKVAVPAIIDRATWDAVQAARIHRRIARRGQQTNRADDPYLLRGAIACGRCGRPLACEASSGIRYYMCRRARPSVAQWHGWQLCDMPMVPAAGLEDYVWQCIRESLLDRDRLAEGMAASRAQHEQADAERQQRLAIIDAEIKHQLKQLERVGDRLLEAERGSEQEAMWKRRAKEIEDGIRSFKAERVTLAGMRSGGLSAEDAESLEAFAAEVRRGFANFTRADIRQVFELLQLRLTVKEDPEGIKLGRGHRFAVDWEASIQLRHSEPRLTRRYQLYGSTARRGAEVYVG